MGGRWRAREDRSRFYPESPSLLLPSAQVGQEPQEEGRHRPRVAG